MASFARVMPKLVTIGRRHFALRRAHWEWSGDKFQPLKVSLEERAHSALRPVASGTSPDNAEDRPVAGHAKSFPAAGTEMPASSRSRAREKSCTKL